MGTYNSTYIGFYLRIPKTTKPITETFRVKPNGEKANTRFNPETGEEYELVTKTSLVKNNPSPYIEDDSDLVEDMFWQPAYIESGENESIFICNQRNDIDFDDEDISTCSLLNYDIQRELLKFKSKYQKYLDYYQNKFGKVEIDFGVINYAH